MKSWRGSSNREVGIRKGDNAPASSEVVSGPESSAIVRQAFPPPSASIWISVWPPTVAARSLPALMCSIDVGKLPNITLHLSADEIGQRGRLTAVGHVNHVDACHHFE